MKPEELRSKSKDELQQQLLDLLQEQFNLRMQKGSGQAPKAHLHNKVRRSIARVKTILKQREGEA
jgi:large subunit ribosomal protein L29